MRIALVALHFAEYAARLALALAEHHDVLLVLRQDNAERELTPVLETRLTNTIRLQISRIKHRPLKDPRAWGNAYRLYAVVNQFRPDVVHAQEYLTDYAVIPLLALWRRYPGILTVHDHVAHSGADSQLRTRASLYRHWLRNAADRLIVHGKCIRAELGTSQPARANAIDSVFHGVLGADSEPFPIQDAEPATLLFFGRIEAYKGLSDLLTACEILVAQGIALRLLIAGRGSDLDANRQRVNAAPWVELQENYIPAEAIPSLFRRATLVVLPYTDATQSGVAALAFALGRPVLATATGALPEVVIDGRTGIVVPPRAPKQLADALSRLLQSPSTLEKLAAGASEFARNELDWRPIARHTEASYAKAISQRFHAATQPEAST